MLSGEEMLRDKKGVHNSFNSPDEINHLDWNNLKKYPQLFNYYKGLIQMRKNHPAFRLGNAELVRKHLEFLPTQHDCLVAFRLKNHAGGDKWNNIYVVLNGNNTIQSINIPKGKYTIVANNGVINEGGNGEMEGGENNHRRTNSTYFTRLNYQYETIIFIDSSLLSDDYNQCKD